MLGIAPVVPLKGAARDAEHGVNIKRDQRVADLLRERLSDPLVVAGALVEQVFAHELNQRYGHR